jgi:hypothetical protein
VPGTEAGRLGRVAGALTGASAALLLVVALLGPSAAEPPLGPRHGLRGLLPSYSFDAHPSSALVTILLIVAYLLGGFGVGTGLLAVRRGFRLDPRRAVLVAAAFAVAAVLVPPIGSADHINYAAYGRIAAQGGDPYVEAPADWHGGHDPITSAVEPPWTKTPSIYGPVSTALQAVTSLLGGNGLRTTIWVWQLFCAVAWLLVGWLVLRFTATSSGERSPPESRGLWLWLLNPVVYGVVLLGAHVDVIATAFMMVALVLAVRQPFWSGVALGAAVGSKLTLVLAVLALGWALRELGPARWRRHGLLGLAGIAVVLVPAHLWAGRHVFGQLEHARIYVSLADPWRPVVDALSGPVGHATVRDWVVRLAPIPVLLLAFVLWRVVRPAVSAGPPGAPDPLVDERRVIGQGAVLLVVLNAAYAMAAPYTLPWYDASVWAPLALVAGGVLDGILLFRLVAYACAYVPGLVSGMSSGVQHATIDYRRLVTPYLAWLTIAGVVALSLRRRHRSP